MNVWERIIIAAGALFTVMVIGILFFVEDIPVPVKSEEELARELFEETKAAELEKLIGISEALMPQISEEVGAEAGGPINLKVIDKNSALKINQDFIATTFPEGELEIIKNALFAVGLLNEEMDLAAAMANLNLSQRSVFFEPAHGVTYAVIDAPDYLRAKEAKNKSLVEAIVHTLQDRKLNINFNILDCKSNLDNLFAFEAVISGQAELLSTANAAGLKPETYTGDLGQEIRDHYTSEVDDPHYKVLNGLPVYLRQRHLATRAAGAAFVQSYLKADPENKMAGIWDRMPVSSEQVLHFDKYSEDDMPRMIDISSVVDILPAEFSFYYTSTLGELDIRILASLYEETRENAEAIAAGWDGLHYTIFKDGDKTILLATSVWDSSEDALEFSNAMKSILKEKYGDGKYNTKKRRDRLSFIAGDIEDLDANQLLLKLETSPATEEPVEPAVTEEVQ